MHIWLFSLYLLRWFFNIFKYILMLIVIIIYISHYVWIKIDMQLAIILVKLSKLRLMMSCEEDDNYASEQICIPKDSDKLKRWDVLQSNIYQGLIRNSHTCAVKRIHWYKIYKIKSPWFSSILVNSIFDVR